MTHADAVAETALTLPPNAAMFACAVDELLERDDPRVEDVCRRWLCWDRDDDTPRLQLAAWWHDHRQRERAEFVRVQCELASLRRRFVPDNDTLFEAWLAFNRPTLRDRERELFVAAEGGQREWFGPVHDLLIAGTRVAELLPWFRRGFIESLTADAADFLQYADAILCCEPVRRVKITALTAEDIDTLYDLWRAKGYPRPYPREPEGQENLMVFQQCFPGIDFELPVHL